jgi:hypothetical protein
MGKFLLPPDGKEPLGRFLPHRRFQIEEVVAFQSDIAGTIIVDAWTITDFASVPRFFWRIISPFDDDVRLPALVHDDMYTRQIWKKETADLVFREALIAHGAPAWKVNAMFQAVNWFGRKAWNDHKAAKALIDLQTLHNSASFLDY